jgi:predicted transcriptional regulator
MKEQVAEIVAAYLRKNHVATDDIPTVITQVYQSLAGLGQSRPEEANAEPLKPAVPIRRSVNDDFIVCLECGSKALMLRRHLHTAHDLTPEKYRQRWNLPVDYPIVAPNYTARRSEFAKAIGLGKRSTAQKPPKTKRPAA